MLMKKTKYVAFCGIISALGVVALLLGGITRVLDLTAVIIATALIFVTFEEIRFNALFVYAVTGLLAFVLPIDMSVAIEYLIFAIYPILRFYIEKLPKVLAWVIKLTYMIAAFVSITLILEFVLGMPEVWYINVVFCVAGVVMFILVDILLKRLSIYYRLKLRKQLRIDKFFD